MDNLDQRKRANLAAIAASAIREEEFLRRQWLYTPQLLQTTVNLMLHTVKDIERPR
ncbi:MAG: hypothetical protein OHK0039_07390 [Bacteroidia bacterium]